MPTSVAFACLFQENQTGKCPEVQTGWFGHILISLATSVLCSGQGGPSSQRHGGFQHSESSQ